MAYLLLHLHVAMSGRQLPVMAPAAVLQARMGCVCHDVCVCVCV
jgi:hypothetical protein